MKTALKAPQDSSLLIIEINLRSSTVWAMAHLTKREMEYATSASPFKIDWKLCPECGTEKPLETRKCRACRAKFLPIYCDRNMRLSEFLRYLNEATVILLTKLAGNSVLDTHYRIHRIIPYASRHECEGQDQCPLWQAAIRLSERAAGMIDAPTGLELRNFN